MTAVGDSEAPFAAGAAGDGEKTVRQLFAERGFLADELPGWEVRDLAREGETVFLSPAVRKGERNAYQFELGARPKEVVELGLSVVGDLPAWALSEKDFVFLWKVLEDEVGDSGYFVFERLVFDAMQDYWVDGRVPDALAGAA